MRYYTPPPVLITILHVEAIDILYLGTVNPYDLLQKTSRFWRVHRWGIVDERVVDESNTKPRTYTRLGFGVGAVGI